MRRACAARGVPPLVYLSAQFVRAKEYLEAILSSSSDAITTTDLDGRVIYFSPGAERMLETPAGLAMGLPIWDFYGGGRAEARLLMRRLLKGGAVADHETELVAPSGKRTPVSMSASLLRDKAGLPLGTLAISKDITRRVELERRLRELSITDSLTGLFNQRHLQDRLAAELQRARRQGGRLSLFLMDLDRFKAANDLWGHLEGDRILKETAGILARHVRKDVDAAFRYGGDEFLALLPGLGERLARRVAHRVHGAFSARPFARVVGLSIGVATLRPADTAADLLRRADERMYRVKRGQAPITTPLSRMPTQHLSGVVMNA